MIKPADALRDIHLPDPVHWWPPAVGWWIIFALAVIILLFGLTKIVGKLLKRFYRRRRLQRIITEVRALGLQAEQAPKKNGPVFAELSMLLRRAAMAYYGRDRVASLQGERWLSFLDETGQTRAFSKGAGRALLTAPYQQHSDTKVAPLVDAVVNWLAAQNA